MFGQNQVISHQVITGEQGKKYCETLPASFERHASESSGGVPIEKTNIDSLNLPRHKVKAQVSHRINVIMNYIRRE